jgi:hypothetical protein
MSRQARGQLAFSSARRYADVAART